MHYCGLKKCDIANGEGVRVTLFVSGCTNHCKGCFQPQTWDFDYGEEYTEAVEKEIFEELEKPFVQGITVLGGEPFEPSNQREIVKLLRKIREKYPEKDIWVFSGFRLEDELWKDGSHPRCEVTDEMLSLIDILIEGRFEEDKKNLTLQFRGSENQRVLDMKKTLEKHEPVIWEKLNDRTR